MTFTGSLSLFLAMIALAALPSSSVALVVVRSATHGVRHGIATSLGIAMGDLVFVALAVAGLAAMAEAMGTLFAVLRYAAAAYLVWFGISLIRSEPAAINGSGAGGRPGGLWISFAAGIGLTLGDVKAILFYAALFPVFVDLTTVTIADIALIAAITVIAVAGVKITYALTATTIAKASQRWPYRRAAQRVAGGAMIAAAGALALKS
ncbi:LysE family translocator [Hoeflea alexandrii]|uniref:LysE family translocator n=1 Tax=Hoeflea alexandrii TaxID=288436 RepID=UPI0022AE7FE9|nr:LysE family translocator [Hoeflea alexandrii]MCZ4291653.1 LysE family translocator [Hoeflea alexandrii]